MRGAAQEKDVKCERVLGRLQTLRGETKVIDQNIPQPVIPDRSVATEM